MKFATLVLLACSSLAWAAPPAPSSPPAPPTPSPPPPPPSVNPFAGRQFFVSGEYSAKVVKAAADLKSEGKTELANKALKLKDVSTFLWVAETSAIPNISTYMTKARNLQLKTGKKQVVQWVIYNLPDRDCSAKASAGELDLANGGEEKYKKFIDAVAAEFKKFPDIAVALQLETDAIGNLVTNLSVEKCANAAPAHKRSLAYGVAKLSLPNIGIYLDGAHAGWLGWPANLGPTADIIGEIVASAKAINPRATIRGISTNVSNYNNIGTGVQGSDELIYIKDLIPLLKAKGVDVHFIVDQGRSGNDVDAHTTWCNWNKAGFGARPSATTPDSTIDAIVWVKPGGESDGTSDPASPRYDLSCAGDDSAKPAPEAGQWFQAYFEQLLTRANPAL